MSDTPVPEQNVLRGVAYKILAVLTFLGMAALIKTAKDIPIGEIVFFRASFGMVPIVIFLAARNELNGALKTNHLVSHTLRALNGFIGMFFVFLAFLNLPLPDATAIMYATPLIIVVLSVILFKENVRLFRGTAVAVGFIGVMIIIWPNLSYNSGTDAMEDTRTFGIIMALVATVLAAIAQVLVRTLTKTESNATIVMYFSLIGGVLALLTIPFGWVMPSPLMLGTLIMVGILGGLGQTFLTESFRHADMSIIAPFEYSSLIFSILVGYFFFAEVPTPYVIIGGLIATAAGVAIILRERYLGLQREAKKVPPL